MMLYCKNKLWKFLFMADHHFFIKLLGICILISGVAMALAFGESDASNLMIAAGFLMYFAVVLGEWWNRK